jgi:hypothetical protein
MNNKTTGYWITTGLFCAVLGFSGLAYLVRLEFMVERMTALSYPVYFLTILGTAKLLGVTALLAPGQSLLKEWAYAGFAFDLIGATASHAFSGDPFAESVRPLFVLGLGAASYLLRPSSRRLPSSPTFGPAPFSAPPSSATSQP